MESNLQGEEGSIPLPTGGIGFIPNYDHTNSNTIPL